MLQGAPINYSVSDEQIRLLNERAQEHRTMLHAVLDEAHKMVIGQHAALERMLIALLSEGHVLIESVPGLAKTTMVKTIAQIFGADSVRIQFTPDLLPADIIGTKIYRSASKSFVTQKGPIFHSFVLADEINRAPAKVQSALLEAMQERQVSIHGDTYKMGAPFVVMATQNPIESDGTYRLPEAQVDRFAMKVIIPYPSRSDEVAIIEKNAAGEPAQAGAVASPQKAVELQKFCREVYADGLVCEYAADIVRATRAPGEYGIDMDGMIEFGASPRASIWLVRTAKALALLNGRGFVTPEDVKALAYDVLRHRIIPTLEAEARGASTDEMIGRILEKIRPP